MSVCKPVSVGVFADLVTNVSSLFMYDAIHVGKSFLLLYVRELRCVHMNMCTSISSPYTEYLFASILTCMSVDLSHVCI